MRVLITGANGFVGSALMAFLQRDGMEVVGLVRRMEDRFTPGRFFVWDPAASTIDSRALEGVDAVVHLAGDNIASGRWTLAKKHRIRASRVEPSKFLAERLLRLDRRPSVVIAASAVGFYGERGSECLTENSTSGKGFLAEVCREWEASMAALDGSGIRRISLRIGMVLDRNQGAMARMLPLFRWGLGGPLGSGRQYVSWIALEDLLRAIQHLLRTSSIQGPVNAVAPESVPQAQFASALGHALQRPAFLPAPGFALKCMLGSMAQELLLASTRVEPQRLIESGFQFLYPTLDQAFSHLLD